MLPDTQGPLSKTLASASIKAANEAVLAALKQQKESSSKSVPLMPATPHNDLCDYLLRRTRQF